jgi:gluconolactonase
MLKNLRVVAEGLRFPEGPVALPGGDVLVVEMERGTLTRVTPAGDKIVVARPGGAPNSAAIGPDGRVYLAQSGGFRFHQPKPGLLVPGFQPKDYICGRIQAVDLDTGAVDDLYTECNGNPLSGPNDLVFDAHGGMWFTDHGKLRRRDSDHGGIYYARADGSFIREVLYPVDRPNGIGLSPDGSQLVFAETQRARLYRFRVTAPGDIDSADYASLAPKSSWHLAGALTTPALLDSLAVDAAGHVLVGTLILDPGLTEFNLDDGSIQHHVLPSELWDPFVTNVCFGGPDLRTAYLTSSGYGRLLAGDWDTPGLELNYGLKSEISA